MEDSSKSSLRLHAWGVCLNQDLELESIKIISLDSKETKFEDGHNYGEANAKENFAALGLFLILTRMCRDSFTGHDKIEILNGPKGTPAAGLADILSDAKFKRTGWINNLIGKRTHLTPTEKHTILKGHIDSSLAGKKTNAKVYARSGFPKIHVFRSHKTIELRHAPSEKEVLWERYQIESDQLKKAAKMISAQIQLKRGNWKNFNIDEAIQTLVNGLPSVCASSNQATANNSTNPEAPEGLEKEEDSEEILLSQLPESLLKWRRILLESPLWNQISFLNLSIPIEEIFTELYLSDYEDVRKSSQYSSSYLTDRRLRGQNTRSVDSILLGIKGLGVFVGDPGAGKSTLIKWIARKLITEAQVWKRFPIVVRLRDFVSTEINPRGYSILEFFLHCYCDIEAEKIPVELSRIKAFKEKTGITPLVLLDGWDEIPKQKRVLINTECHGIMNFGDVLITSRPSGIPASIAQGSSVFCEIGQLSSGGIQFLVSKICCELSKPELINEILEKIDLNIGLAQIASNPFTLTLLCQIMCDERYRDCSLTTSTELFENAVSMMMDYQNSDLHLKQITTHHIDQMSEVAVNMSFSGLGKRIYAGIDLFGYESEDHFSVSPIGQSRLLTKESQFDETYIFLHLQLQEYLAGKRLSRLLPEELPLYLNQYGTDWDYLEEWKFFLGSLSIDSELVQIFCAFWKKRLEQPDRFGGLFCYAAFLFSEIPLEQRQYFDLGIDIESELSFNLKEGMWENLSLKAMIQYAPYSLCRKISAALQRDELENEPYFDRSKIRMIFHHLPTAIKVKSGLKQVVDSCSQRHWLGDIQTETLAMPANLLEMQSIYLDETKTLDERMCAFNAVAYYYTKSVIQDAGRLLDLNDNKIFRQLVLYLSKIGGREAIMILAKKMIEMAKLSEVDKDRLDFIAYSISSSVEPYTKEYLLSQFVIDKGYGLITRLVLTALSDCPMGEEAKPVMEVLEKAKDFEMRILAIQALSRCYFDDYILRALKIALDEGEDFNLSSEVFEVFIRSNYHFDNIIQALVGLLFRLDEERNYLYELVFRLIGKCNRIIHYRPFVERLLQHLEQLPEKTKSNEFIEAVVNCVLLLDGEDKERAYGLLTEALFNPKTDQYTSSSIVAILGKISGEDAIKNLCRILDDTELEISTDTDLWALVQFTIESILEIDHRYIIERVESSHRYSDTMLNCLNKWSEKQREFVFIKESDQTG